MMATCQRDVAESVRQTVKGKVNDKSRKTRLLIKLLMMQKKKQSTAVFEEREQRKQVKE